MQLKTYVADCERATASGRTGGRLIIARAYTCMYTYIRELVRDLRAGRTRVYLSTVRRASSASANINAHEADAREPARRGPEIFIVH